LPFEVARAGLATSFSQGELAGMFQNNFHVMNGDVFEDQEARLVLVKGNANKPVFGGGAGHTCIQRSPPRWVEPEFIQRAAQFISALR
jgi:hypothetical protein